MGSFNFTTFVDSNKTEVTGDVFLVTFIILVNILILNLLIAVLSSTYARMEENKLVLYINEILKLR